jgi:hypothetical protein
MLLQQVVAILFIQHHSVFKEWTSWWWGTLAQQAPGGLDCRLPTNTAALSVLWLLGGCTSNYNTKQSMSLLLIILSSKNARSSLGFTPAQLPR